MKCDLPWCDEAATMCWERSAEEVKAMSTKRVTVPESRSVCAAHVPEWRRDVYLPIGQHRAAAPASIKRKVASRRHCRTCHCQAAA